MVHFRLRGYGLIFVIINLDHINRIERFRVVFDINEALAVRHPGRSAFDIRNHIYGHNPGSEAFAIDRTGTIGGNDHDGPDFRVVFQVVI